MLHLVSREALVALVAAALVTAALPACQSQPAAPPAKSTEALKAAGLGAAVAIYPVRVLGQPNRMVRDVLGLVLERQGMTRLDTVDDPFEPAKDAEWTAVPGQFAAFLQRTRPLAAYALYAEYLGTPKSGPSEVRWLVVERGGALVLSDRQTPQDPDFKRTAGQDPDPLGCSALVATRLFSRLGWTQVPTEGGPFARRWAEASGTPSESERKAMAGRLQQLKDAVKTASFEIHATRIGNKQDPASATRLAGSITQRLGCATVVAATSAKLEIPPTPNQQKHLWDLARGLREFVKAHPPKADYALLVDVLGDPPAGGIGGVQLVVVDKAGDWVLVDFQNNQWEDFQRIDPKTTEDGERLALDRLGARLR